MEVWRTGRKRLAIWVLAALLVSAVSAVPTHPVRAASVPSGGVTLDLYGGLHPFGDVTLNAAGSPYWNGWDIARAISVLPDGSGGWTLDGYGGIHAWGTAPAIASPMYWNGWDIARALVVLPDQHSGYVLDGWGGLHAFGLAPALSGTYWKGWDIARGFDVATDGSGAVVGGWTLDAWGSLHPVGTAPALSDPASPTPGHAVWQKFHQTPQGAYAVGRWGIVSLASGVSPNWNGYSDWGGWDAIRDVTLINPTLTQSITQPSSSAATNAFHSAAAQAGGVTLDLSGGLHPFGNFWVNTAGAPNWNGWDIARSVVVLPDGSGGWTLDGYGGIHAWGGAPAIASPIYWNGWDIARALVVLPDQHSGYVLDGWGGLHAFGGAPVLTGSYWSGWDIARGFDVSTDSSGTVVGGWIFDAWGGLHPLGSTPALADPATYYPNHPIWQKFHYTEGSAYAVGRWGITSGPGVSAVWNGYNDYGTTDAIRDIALVGIHQSPQTAEPSSADALAQFTFAASHAGVVLRPECGVPTSAVLGGKVILVSLICQELSAYENGNLVADTLITTGRPALPTLTGWTSVYSRNSPFLMVSPWPQGSPYYYVPSVVQYVVWFRSGGYGIHDAYWEPSSGLGPGSQYGPYASHGCIHVPLSVARQLYSWATDGTPVGVF